MYPIIKKNLFIFIFPFFVSKHIFEFFYKLVRKSKFSFSGNTFFLYSLHFTSFFINHFFINNSPVFTFYLLWFSWLYYTIYFISFFTYSLAGSPCNKLIKHLVWSIERQCVFCLRQPLVWLFISKFILLLFLHSLIIH